MSTDLVRLSVLTFPIIKPLQICEKMVTLWHWKHHVSSFSSSIKCEFRRIFHQKVIDKKVSLTTNSIFWNIIFFRQWNWLDHYLPHSWCPRMGITLTSYLTIYEMVVSMLFKGVRSTQEQRPYSPISYRLKAWINLMFTYLLSCLFNFNLSSTWLSFGKNEMLWKRSLIDPSEAGLPAVKTFLGNLK